ncbi:hypothetical protein [Streptomyces sp. NPDC060031]|uniref:hypothetical protein n=1 Tax=Streptomyces sp. NPDC060031 TaxID=3347043 RepID=UPI00368D5A18
MGEAGVPVDVRVTGTAYDLPPGIDLCAYRVAQEALTNVDDGTGRAAPARPRARICHGTVIAEPAPEGGFESSLRVPVPRAGSRGS